MLGPKFHKNVRIQPKSGFYLKFAVDGIFSCHYCDVKMTAYQVTKDHKIPKIKGRSDKLDNLLPACSKCNSDKGDMDYEEFIKICKTRKS